MPEFKNIINEIVNGVTDILSLDAFTGLVSRYINENYAKGLEGAEKEFNMNFMPQDRDIAFLNNYVNQNVANVSDQIGKDLRGEIQRGIMAGDTTEQLKTRVYEVFGSMKFSNRLKTILRTESVRAFNQGSLTGAKQAGIKVKKYILIQDDARTSNICHAEHRKYGKPEEAIPLDDQFKVLVDNKIIAAQAPPFHVNCRSTLLYTQVADDE